MIQAIESFGLNARPVKLWHTLTDAHIAVEYESFAFGKPVFYDPLYGVMLLNSDGIPASLQDILAEYSGHGMDLATWSFHPVRLSDGTEPVADARYGWFQDRNYDEILKNYFQMIAVVDRDTVPQDNEFEKDSRFST